MSTKTKVLIIAIEEDKIASFKATVASTQKDSCTFKYSNFETFQEGKYIDKFDMVVVWGKDSSEGDIEMSEELFKHYCIAPVTAWYSDIDSTFITEKFNSSAIVKTCGEDANADFKDILASCNERYTKVLEEDVKPAFNKFDKDGSGAIDKAELGQLSKDLGQELSEDQLTTALKDLDLNNDGVVDLDEFKRWYFTGMKPYNGARRTLLKLGGKATKLMDVLAGETRAALVGQELKTKSSSLSVSFNAPKNPQTIIKAQVDIGGQDAVHKANELREKYHDAINEGKEKIRFVEGWRKDGDDHLFAEIRITTEAGKAQEHADYFGKEITDMVNIIPDSEDSAYFKPKISALDDHTIAIGLKIHYPNSFPMPDDFHQILSHCGQHIHAQLELGTSIEEIMKSEQPVLKSLTKGFSVSKKVCIVSNLKKVFMELMRNEENQEKLGKLLMVSPATMLTLNGSLDLEFDDIEEIEAHPMAGPLMATFDQLFEGGIGAEPSQILESKLDLVGLPEAEPGTQQEFMVKMFKLLEKSDDFVKDLNTGHINVNISAPSMLVNVNFDITAPGVRDAIHLARHLALPKVQEQVDRMKPQKEEEEIVAE